MRLRAKYLLHPLFFSPEKNTVGRFSFYTTRFIQGRGDVVSCHVSVTAISAPWDRPLFFWTGEGGLKISKQNSYVSNTAEKIVQ